MEREKIVKIGIIILIIVGGIFFALDILNPPKIYEGVGDGFEGEVKCKMMMTRNSHGNIIVKNIIIESEDTPAVGGMALNTLKGKVLNKPLKDEIDIVAGATYTSEGFIEALNDVINQFKADEKQK